MYHAGKRRGLTLYLCEQAFDIRDLLAAHAERARCVKGPGIGGLNQPCAVARLLKVGGERHSCALAVGE